MDVVCALIWKDGKLLAVRRNENSFSKGKWEFPGGKVEENENPEEAIKREILEELNLEIAPMKRLPSVSHTYPEYSIKLIPFICHIQGGDLVLNEHVELAWITKGDLFAYDWLKADKNLLILIQDILPEK